MNNFPASLRADRFSQPSLLAPLPTRCPYCPATTCYHWIRNASYGRYGLDSERIRIPRWLCKITKRTFSLLPDALLPYHSTTTTRILQWLNHTFVNGHGMATTAKFFSAARTTVRRVCAKFYQAVKVLRLSGQAGVLPPAEFLRRLFSNSGSQVATLFVAWKEREPKHSLVGMYPR